MQPKNIQDRRKAFINFLIFLVITIAIITTTIFFSTRVPFKQNQQLRDQVNAGEKEKDFSQRFTKAMFDITNSLDTINDKAMNPDILDLNIAGNIARLNSMVESDSVYNKTLYKKIVLTLASLQATKKQVRDLTGAGNINIKNLTMNNQDLQNKINLYTIKIQSIQQLVNTFNPQLPPGFVSQILPQLQQ